MLQALWFLSARLYKSCNLLTTTISPVCCFLSVLMIVTFTSPLSLGKWCKFQLVPKFTSVSPKGSICFSYQDRHRFAFTHSLYFKTMLCSLLRDLGCIVGKGVCTEPGLQVQSMYCCCLLLTSAYDVSLPGTWSTSSRKAA